MATNLPPFLPPTCSKCTFDMFNFLASSTGCFLREPPVTRKDEVQLRSTRWGQARVLGVVWKGPRVIRAREVISGYQPV